MGKMGVFSADINCGIFLDIYHLVALGSDKSFSERMLRNCSTRCPILKK